MRDNQSVWRAPWVVLGVLLGLAGGGLAALFNAPQRGQNMRRQISTLPTRAQQQLAEAGRELGHRVDAALPTDPIQDSLAEGRAAARRRRAELGLEPAEPPSLNP